MGNPEASFGNQENSPPRPEQPLEKKIDWVNEATPQELRRALEAAIRSIKPEDLAGVIVQMVEEKKEQASKN